MVHQHHLFRHATKLSFSVFNAAGGNGIEKRGRQSTGSATALWVTETLAGTLHVPSVLSSTSITPAIKVNGCCDSSKANWLPTQILSLYVLVFAEIDVQCGKLIPVSQWSMLISYWQLTLQCQGSHLILWQAKPHSSSDLEQVVVLFCFSFDKRKLIWPKLKTCFSQWCEKIPPIALSKFHQKHQYYWHVMVAKSIPSLCMMELIFEPGEDDVTERQGNW